MHAGDRNEPLPPRRRPTPVSVAAPSPVVLLAWAGSLTLLLIAGALWPVSPLRDAATGAATDARLHLSPAFVVLAPLNNTLDALSLLSVREHATVWVALVAGYVVWRFAARLRRPAPRSMEELRVAAIALVCLIVVYATGALVSRPMAALSLPAADSDLVTIDFHSHTNASHDGRTWFTPERNRQWHQAAGFDVAYLSDHFTFAGADAGVRANPPHAGEGTVLLSAIECLEGGEHVNVLGVTSADYALFKGRYLAAAAVDAAIAAGRTRPVVIQTIPGPLGRVPRPGMPGVVPVAAIEIADAAPRGLSDGDRNHARILALADTLGLAIVAGTDNHGWGRTAAAWNIMRVPGWRALTPAALEDRIERAIRSDGRHAVRVIERTRPIWPTDPRARGFSGWVSIASGAPRFVGEFVWQFTATRSWSERVSWLAWLWAGVGFAFWRRTRPARRTVSYAPETP
jgi:predicted metal-dependent phosphoesterase TrpH